MEAICTRNVVMHSIFVMHSGVGRTTVADPARYAPHFSNRGWQPMAVFLTRIYHLQFIQEYTTTTMIRKV